MVSLHFLAHNETIKTSHAAYITFPPSHLRCFPGTPAGFSFRRPFQGMAAVVLVLWFSLTVRIAFGMTG